MNAHTILAGMILFALASAGSAAERMPRTVSDVLEQFEKYKPDLARAEQVRRELASEPAPNLDRRELIKFYMARAETAADFGLVARAIEDLRMLTQLTSGETGSSPHAGALAS